MYKTDSLDHIEKISKAISESISNHDYTYEQVSEMVGVSEDEVKAYANGRLMPSLKIAGALC